MSVPCVVDTSAVMAFLSGEPDGVAIGRRLLATPCTLSAATWVELGIVVEARLGAGGTQLLAELRDRAGLVIHPVDETIAADALSAWRRFGKGRHPAALNYGDTFSYALARHLGQPLLFVGSDFSLTDVTAA